MTVHDHSPRFGAVLTAMVTPFDDQGRLDGDGAATLARWLVDHGSDGLVLTGTTGEGPVLTDDERVELWRVVREAVSVPLVVGSGTNDTAHSVGLTKEAEASGADGVLVVTPYYNRPSQVGLSGHFRAVAQSTKLPVMLYDIPVRSGRRIQPDTLIALAHDVTNIVAVKDSAGDLAGTARVAAETPSAFEIYNGEDAVTLPMLSVGAVGTVSVASHWAGVETGGVLAAFAKGDVEGARLANARLIESYAFESSDEYPNPLPAKAMCRVLGLPAGQCRPPMGSAPPALEARAREVLAHLGIDLA